MPNATANPSVTVGLVSLRMPTNSNVGALIRGFRRTTEEPRIFKTTHQQPMRITLLILALLTTAAQATPVTVKVAINVGTYFDYPTRTYMPMPSVSGIVSFTFDIDQLSVIDYGTTTISTFGGTMGTVWSSPLTSQIPSNPASGAYGAFYSSYVFPNVSDYSSTFIEEGAAQANTYRSNGVDYAAYHIELRATRRSAPRAGDGSFDYGFDRNSLLDVDSSAKLSQWGCGGFLGLVMTSGPSAHGIGQD